MDVSFISGNDKFNYRVCAMIISDGKILAMHDDRSPYYYLPGGRVILGETAEYAVNYGGFADKSIPEIVLSGLESKNLEKYLTLSEEKSQLEKRKKEIEAEQRAISVPFVEQLGQGCKAVLEDGTNRYRITYNPTRRTSVGKDQMEKLKNQHPDIYEEYTKTTESRTFRIKKEAA